MKFIMIYGTRFALLLRDGFSVYMDIQSITQKTGSVKASAFCLIGLGDTNVTSYVMGARENT
jgi:hypothetical protein